MSPVPTVGKISFTKFTSPEALMDKLALVEPGKTTAAQVESMLADESSIPGSTPHPLWNDLIDYQPPAQASSGTQVVIDNELLRAARIGASYRYVLLWAALNLADSRLDHITRGILTDSDGRFKADMINRQALGAAVAAYAATDSEYPKDGKPVMNILSLLERCQIVRPAKNGGSIVGVEQMLPTRDAALPLVTLVSERLKPQKFVPVLGGEPDLALAIGANAWIGLSKEEFIDALRPDHAAITQSTRGPIPDDLRELASQLRRKRQVVLQGPPGAGKTYVARKYVTWATANRAEDSRIQGIIDSLPNNERNIDGVAAEIVRRGLTCAWDIVQFHPGYDYTDFVRALVAQPHASGVTFTPQHKIFSLLAGIGGALQHREPKVDIVLILDEVNRGNIANIFGELLYALEYRNEAVSTPYPVNGDASIAVPDNLFLIGTMNTADRSIAVIDYALRRRFVFLDVPATENPILSYPFDAEITRHAALHLSRMTEQALADAAAGLKVGPSYFLAKADDPDSSLDVLAGRFVYEVLPLLAEYQQEGELDSVALADLRKQLAIAENDTQLNQASKLSDRLKSIFAVAELNVPEESPVDAEKGDMVE